MQQLCQPPEFGLGQSGEWGGSCCHLHHSEYLSQGWPWQWEHFLASV